MILRFRGRDGTFRIDLPADATISDVVQQLSLRIPSAQPSTFTFSDAPNRPGQLATEVLSKTVSDLGLKHGDLLFLAYDSAGTGDAATDTPDATNASARPAGPAAVSLSDLDKKLLAIDGRIKRPRDPKFCKHAANGMCEYCSPLEPWDPAYIEEHKIKHLSFHTYLRQLQHQQHSEVGSTVTKFLSQPFYGVKKPCPNKHAPWPNGICSKCQPSAITLQQQQFRMVDHVEFASPSIINRFLDSWRSSGLQRFGYMFGTLKPYTDVPLGIKAVVEVIYEPPQRDESDGLQLTLPWDDEDRINHIASECGLVPLGAIFTDLTDAGNGDGSVICRRHANSYFLSSLEVCFAAEMQRRHRLKIPFAENDEFSSRYVTCVISGNTKGEIEVSAYQASAAAESMLDVDLIEPSTDPGQMLVKLPQSGSDRYVPDIFYRKVNKYGVGEQHSAKPAFPVEYLIVTLSHGFPSEPQPVFSGPGAFPVENRGYIGETADTASVKKAVLNNALNVSSVSDFHLLCYIQSMNILDEEGFKLLVEFATTHEENVGLKLESNASWQTFVMILESS
ncbi:hypothetical protein CANCADRAFT_142508 [Tortispora caseinolytica NRRL Y-17796]|uniref:Nuclear protein localization protein 4 n=1 Tax=Tortispora caseinolytica NRRL Y-17796 TaxID=767744 RepID=A0A1E4TD35_9ASCO|nr:hypothetical protein CANCADRAFT_142508 [Tortispora caseinolytica NRRL Y-17796]